MISIDEVEIDSGGKKEKAGDLLDLKGRQRGKARKIPKRENKRETGKARPASTAKQDKLKFISTSSNDNQFSSCPFRPP